MGATRDPMLAEREGEVTASALRATGTLPSPRPPTDSAVGGRNH
ncbi:hypothetical protein [Streptomyces sp. NPDC005322]